MLGTEVAGWGLVFRVAVGDGRGSWISTCPREASWVGILGAGENGVGMG